MKKKVDVLGGRKIKEKGYTMVTKVRLNCDGCGRNKSFEDRIYWRLRGEAKMVNKSFALCESCAIKKGVVE